MSYPGFLQLSKEVNRIETLKKKLRPASIRNEKKCVKCGFCCSKRTCVPTPKELNKIAKFLDLTPKQLINKYYAIDRLDHSCIYFVKPVGVNIKDLAGKFIPSYRTFNEGACVFLKNSLCRIYPVRPKQAKITKCWLKQEEFNFEEPWKDNKLLSQFGINGEEVERNE